LPNTSGRSAVWLAHLLWEQGVGGSNPLAPIFSSPAREVSRDRVFYDSQTGEA
jgi:hypothetical protein